MDTQTAAKLDDLRRNIGSLGGALVALSGGVDSTLVACIASQELGAKAIAVTSGSRSLKRDDLQLACNITSDWGMQHLVIETDELDHADYARNPVNRCYYCKSTLYTEMRRIAGDRRIHWILNGTNVDDLGDHRPGLLAAEEQQVRSPLVECGIRKAEIREIAAHLGLKNAGKPQAACLSSRIPYGTPVTAELLDRIERAESALSTIGFTQFRVRHHGEVARLELIPTEFQMAVERRSTIVDALKALGYQFISLDLQGFRSGALNYATERVIPINVCR
ncbi:ATP-dependent sacrificial sulfur transferase LarE [Burkholderia sp. Bp9140]|uniref:ATP-dependent sacrificial sulfur transferase LarE n=1 Tax=Burkholderia sp. Bp9140 TaxID=2184572 RepID=UPI000F58673B|nr:ATP-dependent sacrificial sulfur transferase LarE [Burkholderia sp. Bp9140]RQR50033.1 ATP-dependent sacrificial sulfur transferase LarE [Burkholderia sp. Bp9140]